MGTRSESEQVGRLIVVSGLPGVGKTSVAAAIASRMRAVHLSIDAVEEALLGCGLPSTRRVGVAAYEAARVMAELNLRLGRLVVVDAVNDSEEARQTWRSAADAVDVELIFVHLVVSDEGAHRRRLVGRRRGFSHVSEPTWVDVQRRRVEYDPWNDDHIEIDTSLHTLEETADSLISLVTCNGASEHYAVPPRSQE